MTFEELYKRLQKDKVPPSLMISIDPGHTTGVTIFENGVPTEWLQLETIIRDEKGKLHIDWKPMIELFNREPTYIVCENYRIYEKKLSQHTFSGVETLRLIGGIDLLAHQLGSPIRYHMANEHKGFCTDNKLKMWGYWKTGMRHARDSTRLGCYHLLFNKEV